MRKFLITSLMFVLTAVIAAPAFAQQTVDPTVGAACSMNSTVRILWAQTGYFMCQPSANGSSTGTIQKVNPGLNTIGLTINYTNATLVATAATSGAVTLITLPAGAIVVNAIVTNKVAFAGAGPLTALTVSIGDSISATAFSGTRDIFAAASATTITVGGSSVQKTTAADAILATFAATGGNLSALTAGSFTVQLTYILPPPTFVVVP